MSKHSNSERSERPSLLPSKRGRQRRLAPSFAELIASSKNELYSPGFGAPGIVGITSLILFFGGHWFAALAGVEELVLALIGLTLLAIEIFVIPGFGWAGILGILCLIASFTLAMIGVPIETAWHTGDAHNQPDDTPRREERCRMQCSS